MDIRQLNYFVQITEHASFSKASNYLHISQSTLSLVVKNMEDELGVVLLERSTRRLKLTDAGEDVLFHAKRLLRSMEDLHSSLAEVTQMKRGAIKLGMLPIVGAIFFPELFAKFRIQHPQISIQLLEAGGKIIEQSLLEGKIDLGVVVMPVDESLYQIVPLFKGQLKLIVHPEHPLANREEVSLIELRDESFIIFQEGFTLYDRIREICLNAGFHPKISYESTQWDFISESVAVNLGISLLPEPICNKLDRSKISVIPILIPQIHWDLALVWSSHHYLSYAARAWIDFVRGRFQSF